MAITITSHTTVLEEQDNDGDTVFGVVEQRTDRFVIEDEDVTDSDRSLPEIVAGVLTRGEWGSDCYAVFASDWPRVTARTWYQTETYLDPYVNHRTEVSHHLSGPEWTDQLAADVAAIVKWSA